MKKISTFLLLLCAVCGFQTVFAQDYTPLYAGNRSGGTVYTIDTTGMVWTSVSSTTVTSDYGSISGIYGLALDPTDDQMYALYESGGDESNRRLGTYDTETGTITDIGNAGNLTDIDFGLDGSLYGTTGSSGSGYEFREVDKATGATTYLLDHVGSSWGPTIAYDPFADNMIYACDDNVNRIDLGTYVETPLGFDPASECHALVVLNETTAWIAHYGTMRTLDLTSGAQSILISPGYNVQALAFGPLPCNDLTIDVSSYELCEGDEVTLDATSETGGTISWTGGVTDEVPFAPGPPGVYEYTPSSDSDDDCEVTEAISIEVIGLPTVIAGAGDLNFCEDESITLSAAGDADEYVWNDGAELDLMPGPGTYTFTLVGAYTEGGCLGEDSDEVEVTVHELPTITASADPDLICVGNEVTVNGGGGVTYEWDNGVVDGEPFMADVIGTTTYTVIGWDENGCEGTASVDVEVVEGITISVSSVTLETEGDDGEIDIEITGGVPTYTYDWDNDGTGDFDDDQDLTGVPAGTYTVVVMGSTGCEATRTIDLESQVGIEDLNASNVAIYPNPTVDNINIELAGTFQYELVAINGDILLRGTATNKEIISMEDFADGVYFVNVKTDETATTLKVVKK